jgi:hexosaminidase
MVQSHALIVSCGARCTAPDSHGPTPTNRRPRQTLQEYVKAKNITLPELLLEFFTKQREILKTVAPNKRFAYWEEVAVQDPPLPLNETDIVQVWSNQAALQKVFNNTPSKVVISWYENVYLDCGLGNMFGDE